MNKFFYQTKLKNSSNFELTSRVKSKYEYKVRFVT